MPTSARPLHPSVTRRIADTLSSSDAVLVDHRLFQLTYLRVPDEHTVLDDIVFEIAVEQEEIGFSLGELAAARRLNPASYELVDGTLLQFVQRQTVH